MPTDPGEAVVATALVLAGRRGPADPLALAAGVTHKALAPLAGAPMLVHVLRNLRAARTVGRLVVSVDEPELLRSHPELARLLAEAPIETHVSLGSPSRSVLDWLERDRPTGPVLVTTGDHPLLRAGMVDHFCTAARALAADVVVGVVPESLVRARFSDLRRTYLRFRGEALTGANLFLLRMPDALRAIEFWRRAEAFRKRPWRLAAAFGPVPLVLFALRRLDLDSALERASARIGARVRALRLPYAECGVDVDRPADLALAARLLAETEARVP